MGVKVEIHLAGRRRQVHLGIKELNVCRLCCTCWLVGGHLNSMEGQRGVALHLPFHSPPPESVRVCVRQ